MRLVDSADPKGTPAAEIKVPTNGKQVPIPFELKYEPRDINRQRTYELQAEIRTDGKLRFKTDAGQAVTLRGTPNDNIELIVTQASEEPVAITGKPMSISKFGTGSLKIGDRDAQFLVRANVRVGTDGSATVSLSSLDGSTEFVGKLTYYDDSTLRISVENSGNGNASGEIEIKYTARRLNSLSATNLILDGQAVKVNF